MKKPERNSNIMNWLGAVAVGGQSPLTDSGLDRRRICEPYEQGQHRYSGGGDSFDRFGSIVALTYTAPYRARIQA